MRGYKIALLVIISSAGVILALFKTLDINIFNRNNEQRTSLEILLKGNSEFINTASFKQQRQETANGQHPLAVVVTCSDSRVSPELLFSQSIGKLFVIRTAGELVDSLEIGSIEYAVEHLDVPLVVVLGHKKCGAVEAYLKHAQAEGGIKKIMDFIGDEQEIKNIGAETSLDKFIEANARHNTKRIFSNSNIVQHKVHDKKLQLISAIYDIESGQVNILR